MGDQKLVARYLMVKMGKSRSGRKEGSEAALDEYSPVSILKILKFVLLTIFQKKVRFKFIC